MVIIDRAMNPERRHWVLCRRNALSKLNHPLALQVGVDQIHRQHPSGVVESVELDAVLMFPRAVTLTAIPLDQVCEINYGLFWHDRVVSLSV